MIHTVLTTLFDTLFPPSREVTVVRSVTKEQFLCHEQRHHHNEVTVLSKYEEPLVRAAIHAHKFYANHHARTLLAALLARELEKLQTNTYLVPIPLGRGRKRIRGHNQVTSLLHSVDGRHAVLEDILVRTRETTAQSHLPRAQRLSNVRGAFAYNEKYVPARFAGAHLIIIDDVVTTGATLKEAATTLRQVLPPSATVACLAIAH